MVFLWLVYFQRKGVSPRQRQIDGHALLSQPHGCRTQLRKLGKLRELRVRVARGGDLQSSWGETRCSGGGNDSNRGFPKMVVPQNHPKLDHLFWGDQVWETQGDDLSKDFNWNQSTFNWCSFYINLQKIY